MLIPRNALLVGAALLIVGGAVLAAGEADTTADNASARTIIQIDISTLLDARPVTTLTDGKLVTWTKGIDGGGKADGYLTLAAARAVGDTDPHALPDIPLIPAAGLRPDMLLHYSNDEGAKPQAHVVANGTFVVPLPPNKYHALFLAWTSAEGPSPITVELSYSSGEPDRRQVSIPDYYNDAPANDPHFGYVVRDLAKWGPTNAMTETNHHNIHVYNVAPDTTRDLTQLTIGKSGRSYLLFWAATGVVVESTKAGNGR